jgi:DivIVA domain-containing protein
MKITTKLSPSKIVDKEFSAKKHGYDALEVDKFLDEIVDDYVSMENYISKLEKELDDLMRTTKLYKTRMDQAEVQNEVMKEKLGGISSNKEVSLSNIDLLKRISSLEQALYKLGVDPSSIK